jgi:hypothetical protein
MSNFSTIKTASQNTQNWWWWQINIGAVTC